MNYLPGVLIQACEQNIHKTRNQLQELIQANTTKDSVLQMETILADFSDKVSPMSFMRSVSPSPSLAQESAQCEAQVGKFAVEISTWRELYFLIRQSSVDSEEGKRLLKITLEDFKKNGLDLSEQKLHKVRDLKFQLSQIEIEYSENLNRELSELKLTTKDLEGLPKDYISQLNADSDLFTVPINEADFTILMKNVSSAETRKKVLLAFYTRGGDRNLALLDKAINLRRQIARIMGFNSWAKYNIQNRAAKDSQAVMKFLNELKSSLQLRNDQEFTNLLKFKQEIVPNAKSLEQWDLLYFQHQRDKKYRQVDSELLREYFPLTPVFAGLLDVYSQLLSLRFEEILNAPAWHKDVRLFSVYDQKSNSILGYFFTDFFPRAGKYDHAAAFPIISGRKTQLGYQLPISALVANFNPPRESKPSLLSHSEVVTLFHEFGHIMHQLLTKAPYASLSGSSVAQDFVEAPSQMMENWAWSMEILNKISGHYLRPEEKIPEQVLRNMIQIRDSNKAMTSIKQLLYAFFDMQIHGDRPISSVNGLYLNLYRSVLHQEPAFGQQFPASFGHLMSGYDAGYYGYLWSEVYAADMFTQFFPDKLLNPELGEKYKHSVLEVGNMQDAAEILQHFLGRDPSSRAFLRSLGIKK